MPSDEEGFVIDTRPQKRRRLDDEQNSPPSSADELAPSSQHVTPKPLPGNRKARRDSETSSKDSGRRSSRPARGNSPDELHHTAAHNSRREGRALRAQSPGANGESEADSTNPRPDSTPLRQESQDESDSEHDLVAAPGAREHDDTNGDNEETPRASRFYLHDGQQDSPKPGSSPVGSSPVPTPDTHDSTLQTHYKPVAILRGHKRAVSAVKFSPDGRMIASCSADATLKIWDSTSGAHMHTLSGHLAGISTLSWAPDSRTLASGSDDKSIRLWDVTTGRCHASPLLGHHNYVISVAFSPQGNMLVSGSYDEAVFVWDVRTGRVLRSLPAHSDPVCGVDFVRDGTLIVSCSSDGLIRVWDTATGQCLRTFFHEDTPPVGAVRFSPNGKFILTGMLDSSLRMWNYVEGKCVKTYKGHVNARYYLGAAFGVYGEEDAGFVVSGGEDGRVFLWDVVSKSVLQVLPGQGEMPSKSGMSEEEWDALQWRKGHKGPVLAIDVHPTEKALVSCGFDKTIRIWRDESQTTIAGID